jgi:hypothetical protein
MTARTIANLKANWHSRDPYDQAVDVYDTMANPQDPGTHAADQTFSQAATFNGTAQFNNSVYIDGGASVFHHGNFASVTAGSAFDLGSATAAARIYADDGSADLSGNRRAFLARALVTESQTGAATLSAMQAQVKFASVDLEDDAYFQGLYGYAEVTGTTNVGDGTDTTFLSGVRSVVEFASGATIELKANSYAAAFTAELNDAAGATVNGETTALLIPTPANGNWVNAMAFESAGASYPCGVKASEAVAGTASYALRVDIDGTAGYIPVYLTESFDKS